MWCKITFCISVMLTVLVVVLLALLSPQPINTTPTPTPTPTPTSTQLDLSLYIQQPYPVSRASPRAPQPDAGALIFRRTLTEGPEDTSRAVGRAQGFIIPTQSFARSGFNIVYLSFDTPEYSGSLGVQARHVARGDAEVLTVVGGTGVFAFARGLAVFADRGQSTYHVKLQLTFPNQSRTIRV